MAAGLAPAALGAGPGGCSCPRWRSSPSARACTTRRASACSACSPTRRAQGGTSGIYRSFGALARTLGPLAGPWMFAGRRAPLAVLGRRRPDAGGVLPRLGPAAPDRAAASDRPRRADPRLRLRAAARADRPASRAARREPPARARPRGTGAPPPGPRPPGAAPPRRPPGPQRHPGDPGAPLRPALRRRPDRDPADRKGRRAGVGRPGQARPARPARHRDRLSTRA